MKVQKSISNKAVKLTSEEVRHVANLAKLGLSEEDTAKFQKQLSSILDFVSALNEVDTKDVIPTSQVTGLENVFREDEVKPSLSQEEVLSNAPDKYKGYFRVKKVLEE